MMKVVLAGLVLGGLLAVPASAEEHYERIEHQDGPVDAKYRAKTTVNYSQVGMAAPGGRPSSLRCDWTVDMAVSRHARHDSGSSMLREIGRERVLSGSRPGWCRTQRDGIAREIAARTDEIRSHLRAAAQDDRIVLAAEVDRLGAGVRQ